MRSKLATLSSIILVLSILIPGSAAADLDFTIDSDSSQVEVPGTATISGEVRGEDLNSVDIQRYSDGDWEDVGTPEVCTGEYCEIERTHSRISASDVKFRVEAYVDTEIDPTYSKSITVEFVESTEDPGEQDDSSDDQDQNNAYISDLEIEKSSDRLETAELVYIEGEMRGSELNSMTVQRETPDGWTTVGTPEPCYGTSCEIERSHTRLTEGSSTFRIKGYDNENPPEYSREVTVEFYEEDEDDGYEDKDPQITDISISSSADRVKVSNLVYIDGRMKGTRLDRIRVERETDYGWTTVGTNKDCSGSRCSIQRSHSRLSEGTPTFRVVGYDQDGDRLETREIDVEFYEEEEEARNPRARLDIDPDEAQVEEMIEFDASDSYSRDDSDIETYRFDFDDDGYYERVTTRDSVTTSFDHPRDTEATVQVETERGRTDSDSMRYEVTEEEDETRDPRARLDIDPDSANVGEEVEFDASDSYSRDESNIETYRFDLDSDGDYEVSTDDSRIEREFDDPRDAEATVQVETERGRTDTDSQYYEVVEDEEEAEDPVARLDVDPETVQVGEEIEFDASDSYSRDESNIETYRFDLDSDGDYEVSTDENSIERTFDDPRDTEATVQVETERGATDTDTVRYEVIQDDEDAEDPVARLNIYPERADVGEEIEFDASDSYSRDENDIESYRFDLDSDGDYEVSTGDDSITRTFDDPRDTEATVQVETEAGRTDTDTESYEVLEDGDVEGEADLTVHVEGSDDEELENAFVEVTNGEDTSEYTDNDGEAGFSLEAGEYTIDVSKPGYGSESRTVEIEADEDREVRFVLSIDQDDKGQLTVEVEDSSGDELSGVSVNADNSESKTRTTNSEGEVEFYLLEGKYDVTGEKDGYYSDTRTIEIDDDEEYELELELGEEPNLEVREFDLPLSVCRGEEFRADFTLHNNQDRFEEVEVAGITSATTNLGRELSIAPEASQSSYLTFSGFEETGVREVQLRISNGENIVRTGELVVENCETGREAEQASAVSLNTDRSEITAGESVTVSGYVDGVQGTSNVDIEVEDDQETTVSTTRGGYYETRIRPEETGTVRITATTRGFTRSTEVEVLPTVAVHSMSVDDPAFAGREFQVCGDVSTQRTARVVLEREGRAIESKQGSGETCFAATEPEEGEYQYRIRAIARNSVDTKSMNVRINPSDQEVSSFPGHVSMTRSGPGIIRVELYNGGTEAADYSVELSGIPDRWVDDSEKRATISPGDREEVYIYLTPTEEGSYAPEVTVEKDGEDVYSEEVQMSSGGTTEERSGFLSVIRSIIGI